MLWHSCHLWWCASSFKICWNSVCMYMRHTVPTNPDPSFPSFLLLCVELAGDTRFIWWWGLIIEICVCDVKRAIGHESCNVQIIRPSHVPSCTGTPVKSVGSLSSTHVAKSIGNTYRPNNLGNHSKFKEPTWNTQTFAQTNKLGMPHLKNRNNANINAGDSYETVIRQESL